MSSPEILELAKKSVEELFRPFHDLILKLAGPLIEQTGEGLGFLGGYFRNLIAIKLFQKTQKMIEEAGFDPTAVRIKLFLPILENATLEEEEAMQENMCSFAVALST